MIPVAIVVMVPIPVVVTMMFVPVTIVPVDVGMVRAVGICQDGAVARKPQDDDGDR